MASNFLSSLGGMVGNQAAQPNAIARLLGMQMPEQAPIQTRAPTAADFGPAPSIPQAAPRQRRSVLDMIGGIADTVATVGGAPAQYQSNIDAQRQRAEQERQQQRAREMEPLQDKMLQNQMRAGEQNIEAGDLEIAEARKGFLDAAGQGMRQVFSRTGKEGILKAWPLIAQQLQIPPEQQEAIGQALMADPEGTMAALFPEAPQKQQSLAAPVQVAEWLRENGTPEEFAAYRQSIANPDSMTPAQQAQLALALEKFEFERYKFANPQPTATERSVSAKSGMAAEERDAANIDLLGTLDELEGIYGELRDTGAIVSPEQSTGTNIVARLRASGPGQLVEGAIGTEAQTLRDRVESIRPGLMQKLAKATGMTGKQLDSNADVKLFMQTVTDPTRSYEANVQAIEGLRRFVSARQQAQQTPSPRRPNVTRNAPTGAPRKAPPQRAATPPAKGTVMKGYRFNGGDPANRANWTKVR